MHIDRDRLGGHPRKKHQVEGPLTMRVVVSERSHSGITMMVSTVLKAPLALIQRPNKKVNYLKIMMNLINENHSKIFKKLSNFKES